MRYAIIQNGVVINAVEASSEFAAGKGWIELPEGYGPGDLYDNLNEFSHPEPVATFPDLDPWRFWAVVNLTPGLGETNLRAAIGGLSDATFKAIALAKLDNPPGNTFSRGDALFSNTALQAALGMNAAAIDALWTAALGLPS